jgi:hypothetical protein
VQVRPKDAFECSFDAASGYYTIRARSGGVDAAGAALRLLLKITPARQPAGECARTQRPRSGP